MLIPSFKKGRNPVSHTSGICVKMIDLVNFRVNIAGAHRARTNICRTRALCAVPVQKKRMIHYMEESWTLTVR